MNLNAAKRNAMLAPLVALLLCWTGSAQAASFNCAKAKTKVEKIICTDSYLAALDAMMHFVWREVLANMPGESKNEQRAWLAERNTCTEDDCIQQSYRKRLEQLDEKIIQDAVLYRQKNPGQISYPDEEQLFGIWEGGTARGTAKFGGMIISKQHISWTSRKPNPGCKTAYTIISREVGDTFPDQSQIFRPYG